MSSLLKTEQTSPSATANALVFYSQFDDPQHWGQALKSELPDLDFRVAPDVGDPETVGYVLAWQPPSGFFARFNNIKLVVNLGAGVDSLTDRDDLPDVPICRLSDAGMLSLMRSYVLFGVTRYARDMPEFEAAKKRREWHYIHPTPLNKIRVGVVGLGTLGSAVASSLVDLGFDVYGWDLASKGIPGVKVESDPSRWLSFFNELDIVVNMLPITKATEKLLNAGVFAAMKPGAKFINASRGRVVDEPALIEALKSGQVGGATLDVFWEEPLQKDHPFWDLDNVYITPHLASITIPEAAARDVAESIRRIEAGESPLNQINPKAGF